MSVGPAPAVSVLLKTVRDVFNLREHLNGTRYDSLRLLTHYAAWLLLPKYWAAGRRPRTTVEYELTVDGQSVFGHWYTIDVAEATIVCLLIQRRKKRRTKKKRYWIHPLFSKRHSNELFNNYFNDLRKYRDHYFNYTRMSAQSFDKLLIDIIYSISDIDTSYASMYNFKRNIDNHFEVNIQNKNYSNISISYTYFILVTLSVFNYIFYFNFKEKKMI